MELGLNSTRRLFGSSEFDAVMGKIHDGTIDTVKVRNDGSAASASKLDRATEVVPIAKAGVSVSREVDALLVKCNQLDPDRDPDHKYTREWLARQLNISPGDLNKALQPTAPAKTHNGAANRALTIVKTQVKRLERARTINQRV
jgi:uncharacterized protein YqkB